MGTEPWIILFTEDYPGSECVKVAVHQDLQIWNKGYDDVTIEWFGLSRRVGSDEHFATGPIGDLLAPGPFDVEARPYEMPQIQVVDPAEAATAGMSVTDDGIGPIELGMTIGAASDALGRAIDVDPELSPGLECWVAVIADDPYSPMLTVEGVGGPDSMITGITITYPPGEQQILRSTGSGPCP